MLEVNGHRKWSEHIVSPPTGRYRLVIELKLGADVLDGSFRGADVGRDHVRGGRMSHPVPIDRTRRNTLLMTR